MTLRLVLLPGILALMLPVHADVTGCACELSKPESMAARECSLCREAEMQSAEPPVFFLKDVNPRKPNRLLALPRAHGKAQHSLASMEPSARLTLWVAAIEKARSLWGENWALAVNGDESRTQCHAHIHIGKLIDGLETARIAVVDGPSQIPAPRDGTGLWVHPEGGKLHVHLGEQLTEAVLLR